MAALFVGVAPAILGFVLWKLLDRHERRGVAAGFSRHSGKRLAAAAFGLLLALFSVALAAALGFALPVRPDLPGAAAAAFVASFTVPPLVIGLAIFGLSMRRKAAIPPSP
jgi:hypothetical protein